MKDASLRSYWLETHGGSNKQRSYVCVRRAILKSQEDKSRLPKILKKRSWNTSVKILIRYQCTHSSQRQALSQIKSFNITHVISNLIDRYLTCQRVESSRAHLPTCIWRLIKVGDLNSACSIEQGLSCLKVQSQRINSKRRY